ncbi:hypothetical protein AGABI1DRAFT_111204 [Agaricus bisporus var. burnettii JB137-S8]|uniref:CRA domain-containing protein n=1 Tax=Agaricus bisporus var. burnettii (strain JB137-S8 / ATCC MYA-4627 / FGSC 10392) TaxID=597362 RepID=K5Y3S0_AGABU|nr:uncharacterized protein AGABI1DRAFT_111204 [Agaricus bisporus var. burnettii JB137-S8]EKM82605.1 hypothetical protein AGABI1DRAFT_111204 [Agaricus bisporus var. burnettii JB137-S8]
MPPPPTPASSAAQTTSSTPVTSSSRSTKPSKGSFTNPTPYQLRSLVMDYLCHHCYTRTALAFAKDGTVRHLDADGDEIVQPQDKGIFAGQDALELSNETLREAELRNDIRVKILSGNVDDAIELLNEHFPSVLGLSTPNAKSYPSSLEAMKSANHLIPTTTDPRHLLLNLRILGFTELCRTKPLVYSSPSLRTNEIDMSESDVIIQHDSTQAKNVDSEMNDNVDTDAEADTDVDGTASESSTQDVHDLTPHTATVESNGDSKVELMIHQGQKLYALLEQIDHPAEKELYKKELVNVGALLAYPEPEDSPLARYLSMERREAVAEQINKAILTRMGQSPTSNIEVITRYTTVLWALANEMKVKARPGATVPPVQQLPRPPTPPLPAKQVPESDQRQVVPAFNLQTFLDLR